LIELTIAENMPIPLTTFSGLQLVSGSDYDIFAKTQGNCLAEEKLVRLQPHVTQPQRRARTYD